ncbi:isoprenyl transferase [Tenuifilaceae bacterium CYCD]|nr:isoprenyl transferase [Tenuifilaceae bacterium CYCD]
MALIDQINREKVPQHVAIIMDGNGRWAQQRGNQRIFGHQNGVKAVRAATEAAGEIGVKYLTLYAFSSENWNRPKSEVDALMGLLVDTINSEIDTLLKNDIRLLTIGDIDSLPKNVKEKLQDGLSRTAHCKTLTAILALSYGARNEIVEATKKIIAETKTGKINPNEINSDLFAQYLDTAGIPDPALMIRTSGEIRLSNFLLWQLAYAELYFTPVLWPDFTKDEFFKAVIEYQKRERRFGKTSEQL